MHLQLLPVLAFLAEYDLDGITSAREINAAAINISGRQRMLSQRTAFFCLRLVCSQDKVEREKWRKALLCDVVLMEKSHNGLLNGDPEMKLASNLSEVVKAMYFQPPLNLDRQIRNYIAEVRALVQSEDSQLTQDNSHLQYILNAASSDLLTALDRIVSQYQKESEAEQLALDIYQAELYKQSCSATAAAQAQAKHLEKVLYELQEAQAQLIHSERISSLGQLVAGVAHEINNPVNFIYGNLTYAKNYLQDLVELLRLYQQEYPHPSPAIQDHIAANDLEFSIEDLPEVLRSMKVGADRIRQIVQSLRNFSRTDEEEMKPVDIHEGIDSTLLILHCRLKASGEQPEIKAIQEYGDLPLVECHIGQLNQVFMNLLSNAIDAFEGGVGCFSSSPEIRIRTEVASPESVIIRIADNGPGMTQEVKARVFDRFFTTKPIGRGTGLGLSISHQIVVEKHGGSLGCISELGKGTEFWIEIPICQSKTVANTVRGKTVNEPRSVILT